MVGWVFFEYIFCFFLNVFEGNLRVLGVIKELSEDVVVKVDVIVILKNLIVR